MRASFLRVLVLLLLVLPLFATAQEPLQAQAQPYRELDAAAVEAYRKQDLGTARQYWERCLEDPQLQASRAEKGRILYDLGNVAYRDKQLLEAVGWYTAALRERPRDSDTWSNLEQARSDAHLEPADRGDLVSSLERLVSSLTLEESRALALYAGLVWALFLAGEAFFGGRTWAWLARISTLGMLACLVPWVVQGARAGANELLVIAPQPLELRSEPRADAARILELAPGARVVYQDELPDWIKVDDGSAHSGWAPRAALFPLAR
ncbi:MAG: SH3 domain-containing protein [Planctomycetes bacterium]|nr:SH3 domain-containing protein [Planctomycetota bacterium]